MDERPDTAAGDLPLPVVEHRVEHHEIHAESTERVRVAERLEDQQRQTDRRAIDRAQAVEDAEVLAIAADRREQARRAADRLSELEEVTSVHGEQIRTHDKVLDAINEHLRLLVSRFDRIEKVAIAGVAMYAASSDGLAKLLALLF